MTDKDTLYHELLDAFRTEGCAICFLSRQASDRYIRALLYEGVTDPDLRGKLRDARGLCYQHGWRMAQRRGSVLGTAIVYQDVINTLTKALEAEEPSRSRWRGTRSTLATRLAASRECPACELDADAERRAIKTLLKHINDPEVAGGYVSGGGLCLPHFQTVLAQGRPAAIRLLVGWHAEAFRTLRDHLDELIRKHDYRFAGETITEEESVAWERAVASVVGDPEPTPDS
jgi:hypothetical protein